MSAVTIFCLALLAIGWIYLGRILYLIRAIKKTKEKISSGEISQEEGNLRIDALQAKLD